MIEFDLAKYDFTTEEMLAAAASGRLLTCEIEFNRSCNYLCPYCYAAGTYDHAALTDEMARSAICQVAALGARKVVVLGGEPLLCKNLKQYIILMNELGMGAEIFTNASLIDEEWARFFYEQGSRVVVKLNSLDPEVQDNLTGVPHSLDKALYAIDLLQKAGLDERRLVASSVICSANEAEVVDLWKHLRSRGIRPYLEIMTPQGRLLEHRQLEVHPRRIKEIFEEIAAFDRSQGREWEPQPPLVGGKCLRHHFSCVICANGDVIPCVGLTIKIGNVYERQLADILQNSNVLRKLKDFRNTIKGPCRTCEKADTCYGCRGAAYQLTGDYLASDPLCWKNCDSLLNQKPSLPSPAQQWIPHRPPMTLIKQLIEFGEWSKVETVIEPDNRFLRNSVLDPEVIPEFVAQSCAVIAGFEVNDHTLRGMLTGMRHVKFLAELHVGDELIIAIRETSAIDNYYSLDFKIFRKADNMLCSEGELSICQLP
ncbi:MAG: radical SAM protein [Lentisphaeria bacterium]|nr:radical SAM protein [Lentisphaeria bacterium]